MCVHVYVSCGVSEQLAWNFAVWQLMVPGLIRREGEGYVTLGLPGRMCVMTCAGACR